jgi:hypothetical protein
MAGCLPPTARLFQRYSVRQGDELTRITAAPRGLASHVGHSRSVVHAQGLRFLGVHLFFAINRIACCSRVSRPDAPRAVCDKGAY